MKNPGRNETRCEHMGSIPATHINGTGGDTVPSHLKIRVLVHEGSYDPKRRAKRRRSKSTEDRRSPDERGNHGRMTIKSRLDPAGEPTGQRDVTLQELSRKVSAMARRYGCNVSSDDESDSPFIETIARTQFLDRFRMPTIEQYKENRDPKEHVRRFRNIMAQYSSNDGLLCLTFPQTFGDLASRWFGRLPPGSISSFSNLSNAFIRQFMGSVQRRKSLAHLSNLKQERNESIKKYLARFGKEVAQIEDASDVAVVAAFTNGLQSGRLSFDLRRERPKTYEEMMEIAGDYALAEEEEVAQGGNYVHGHKPDSKPDHKDDKKTLIRDGHLKDFALKGDKHGGRQDSRQGNGQDRKSPRRNSPNATINTIFGGPHTGRSNRERMSEVREVMKDLEPFHVPLKGFGGAEVRSSGTVKLPVRFGTAPCRRTILLDFVVVDIHNWPYNALLGRPFLNKARAVTSTHALKIKFPTEFGVGELRGSQEMARRANLSIFKDKAGMETLNIFEVDREVQEDNLENFELDPRDKTSREKEEPTESVILEEAEPDKTVKIGARLTEQVKKDVTNLLREYKEIFAWCHEDMPGIDRSVISHNPGCE
ncbi:hypothetical protein LWI29_036856 [Acer saccharum]|uniref:Retrotransposon gag domain-containing protein n=1 Tax=Acer saccharum TaxID=4024 RepID=A0AA39S001_ACESA|nr:hypothetical protein LWI29_036856 [Acer saccharum]